MDELFEEQRRYYELQGAYFWVAAHYDCVMAFAQPYLRARSGEGAIKILEVGCGTGNMTGRLKSWGEVTGVDASRNALSSCRERHGIRAEEASADNTPFDHHTFDFVFAVEVIEHIRSDEQVVKEFYRILKPGGYAIATVPAFMCLWGSHDEMVGHFRRYRKSDFARLAAQAGFKIVKVRYFNSLLFAPMWILRRIKKIMRSRTDDFYRTRPFVNRLLYGMLKIEIPVASTISLPFGTSLVAVLQKEKEG